MNSIKARAIDNNAQWCASIWKAHKLPVVKEKNYWFCPVKVPDYYPNIITLAPDTDTQIAALLQSETLKNIHTISIKDSFDDLILSDASVNPLFRATWLYKQQSTNTLEEINVNWRHIKTETDLGHWEESWDTRSSNAKRIFLPSLLIEKQIEFWAGYNKDHLVCGYITNRSDSLIGLSNVFGDYTACINHAAFQYAAYDLVGYEHGENLEIAKSLGFKALENLSIWISAV